MEKTITTTPRLIRSHANQYPDIPVLLFYDEIVSYKDLDERSERVAAFFEEKGIQKGDIISFMLGNTPSFFYTLFGIQKTGAIASPVSCWWQAEEVTFLVNDCKPKVIVIDPEYVQIISQIKDKIPSVEHIIVNAPQNKELDFDHISLPGIIEEYKGKTFNGIEPEPHDCASIMYTSGTTGTPKGVLLTHKGVIFGSDQKQGHVPIDPGEKILCVLPLFHSGGLNDLAFTTLYSAATIVLRRNFSASEFWECVEKYKVNGFYVVPTMWNILLRAPESDSVDTSSLRIGLSGAAPIPPAQLAECEKRFNTPILEAYGVTENTGGVTANMENKKKFGSVGTAFSGIKVKIFDENGISLLPGEAGEIVIKGDTVMKGYFNNPKATRQTIRDGWLYTGDVGYLDEEGFLFIVDRIKDMIIRGGVNVYPKEIEEGISGHPLVNEVSVIPEAHDIYGQVPKACVVLQRGATCAKEEIISFCKERMAGYKVPEKIEFRAGLPLSAVGKVLKKNLILELEEEKSADPVPCAPLFEGMIKRFLPDKAAGVRAGVSYNITGKGGGLWTVNIDESTIAITRKILKDPRVYIVARDCDYFDVATGKLDGLTAVLTGKMKIEGDINFMGEFKGMFAPIENDSIKSTQ